jgi:putative transposase
MQLNKVWPMDFFHDQLEIRIFTTFETFSRFSPIVDLRFSYRCEDVVRALKETCAGDVARRPSPYKQLCRRAI